MDELKFQLSSTKVPTTEHYHIKVLISRVRIFFTTFNGKPNFVPSLQESGNTDHNLFQRHRKKALSAYFPIFQILCK